MEIKLTKQEVSDLLTILFVGSMSFQDEKNKENARRLHADITIQYTDRRDK